MTADDFRRLALAMPGAVESAHMRHPDFRVGKTIFATLGYPKEGYAMVKLAREQQSVLVSAEPFMFAPASGAWGRNGATIVTLAHVDEAAAADAIRMAWSRCTVDGAGKQSLT
jgi:hypothetical protein